MTIKEAIISTFKLMLNERDVEVQDDFFEKDFILLDSGLDSLGFAVLVAKLEQELQYDPFLEMEAPIYPATFFEFVTIYENNRQKKHL